MQIVPFLKWAGGKRWFASSHAHLFNTSYDRLIEPFCGSAAIFFHLQPPSAILSDANDRLIEVYRVIRDSPVEFSSALEVFAKNHSPDYYYETRAEKFDSCIERAAQFLYLNRVCFNGIYRENLKGKFNVPLGTKQNVILATDDFHSISMLLQGVELRTCDFETVVDDAGEGDLVFIDPPYTVKHNNNGFVKYNQKIFSWDDQVRLAEAATRASLRGAKIVVTNADHEEVRSLYNKNFKVLSVDRKTVIASRAASRGVTSEMVAINVD
jgi:DNA adenine methylase